MVSLSNAYCFNCLTKLFGRSHVVLTFDDSLTDFRCDIENILHKAIYTVAQKDLLLPYCCIYGMPDYGRRDIFVNYVRPLTNELKRSMRYEC